MVDTPSREAKAVLRVNRKEFVSSVKPRLKRSEETQERFEVAGCDVMDYEERWGRYRIRPDQKIFPNTPSCFPLSWAKRIRPLMANSIQAAIRNLKPLTCS
jgi:hypothetical protein